MDQDDEKSAPLEIVVVVVTLPIVPDGNGFEVLFGRGYGTSVVDNDMMGLPVALGAVEKLDKGTVGHVIGVGREKMPPVLSTAVPDLVVVFDRGNGTTMVAVDGVTGLAVLAVPVPEIPYPVVELGTENGGIGGMREPVPEGSTVRVVVEFSRGKEAEVELLLWLVIGSGTVLVVVAVGTNMVVVLIEDGRLVNELCKVKLDEMFPPPFE